MQPKVLLIGNDQALLRSRGLIIRHDGFSATEIFGLASLNDHSCQDAAVAVLCHGLSLDEKLRAIKTVRHTSPRAMILNLCSSWSDEMLPEHANASVVEGPGHLLMATRDLARRWTSHLP